jgi:hypothetical protein
MREMDLIWMLVVTRDAFVGVKYGAARNTPDVHVVYVQPLDRTAPRGTEKMMDEPRQFCGLIQSKTPGWTHATSDERQTLIGCETKERAGKLEMSDQPAAKHRLPFPEASVRTTRYLRTRIWAPCCMVCEDTFTAEPRSERVCSKFVIVQLFVLENSRVYLFVDGGSIF